MKASDLIAFVEARKAVYEWANTRRIGNTQPIKDALEMLDTAVQDEIDTGPPILP